MKTALRRSLKTKLWESLVSVLPVSGLILLISFTPLAPLTWLERTVFAVSALMMVLGIGLFNLGADLAMTPMGRHIGVGLTRSRRLGVLMGVCFLMGVLITVAEPDLSVLAGQISAVVNPTLLIVTVGLGVGLFLMLAVIRIVSGTDLTALLIFFYMLMFAFAALLISRGGQAFLPLAFDSGGVTTGPITVPFIMAMGVGIAQTLGGRDAGENSFGLIALCSAGPVLAVLLLSLGAAGGGINYPLPDYSLTANFSPAFWSLLGETAWDVAKSLLLTTLFFAALQFSILHLPGQKLGQILTGQVIAFLGLVVFLVAVAVGFMPIGFQIGHSMASTSGRWLLAFAFVVGMVTVLAEPAVHVLTQQVEEVTDGTVTRRQMLFALSIGVGASIGLSVLRLLGFSLLNYLIPGYLLSLGLSFFVPKLYTAIAFDSGGVASGPLTSSFILPLAIGACVALRGADAVLDFAFGVIALVAMTPLITIQTLGFRSILSRRMRKKAAIRRILSADDAQIIYFQ